MAKRVHQVHCALHTNCHRFDSAYTPYSERIGCKIDYFHAVHLERSLPIRTKRQYYPLRQGTWVTKLLIYLVIRAPCIKTRLIATFLCKQVWEYGGLEVVGILLDHMARIHSMVTHPEAYEGGESVHEAIYEAFLWLHADRADLPVYEDAATGVFKVAVKPVAGGTWALQHGEPGESGFIDVAVRRVVAIEDDVSLIFGEVTNLEKQPLECWGVFCGGALMKVLLEVQSRS
jgi:hypothetical protein